MTTADVFEDHLEKRLQGKVEEDIAANYAEHVILLTGTGMYKGHAGVRESAAELQHYLKDAKFSYDNKLVEGVYAFLEWSAKSHDRKVCDGADSFVIKDGKIVFQSIHYSVITDG